MAKKVKDTRLGKQGKDKVTGFEGIVIGSADYLTGCTQLGLAPPVKDGKLGETHWFDEGRVEITGDGISGKDVKGQEDGGPNRDAPRS